MKFWAHVLVGLAALPDNAYTQAWTVTNRPSHTLQVLQRRADTCPSANPVSCAAVDSKLPSDFCCPSNSVCQPVDNSSSAMCCEKGQNCDVIGPISCDVGLQNPQKNTGPIFTTRTSDKLPTCGSQCCPFGYTCSDGDSGSVCVLDKSKAGPATTSQVTSTSSATVTSTPTNAAVGIDSNDPPPAKESNAFPVGIFFAGFVPGILVGVLATLAWVVLTKRHNKPADTRGLATHGFDGRPTISAPIMTDRHSNERSDFLARTRSRARSMFSVHRRSRTVDSVDFWNSKMPTPPPNNNIPVNYVNNMPDVPVTPARRVAKFSTEDNFIRGTLDEKSGFSPEPTTTGPPMPAMPSATVPPLRGMTSQRRVSSTSSLEMPYQRRDSGTAMGTIGSPFQTPERKAQVTSNNVQSVYGTYDTVEVPSAINVAQTQTLTPARYDPVSSVAPSAAALAAANRLGKAQQSLPSQQGKQPTIPPRPQGKPTKRPETQVSDFDFDEGLDQHDSPVSTQSPPRAAYQSQATGNPYALSRANPNQTFDSLVPPPGSKQDKHATNATTFTSLLRDVGFPDPGNQMPAVPKVDVQKVKEKSKGKGKGKLKGMI